MSPSRIRACTFRRSLMVVRAVRAAASLSLASRLDPARLINSNDGEI